MDGKPVNSLSANRKRHYYINKVLRTIPTKSNIFGHINQITSNRLESEQFKLRMKGGAIVDDGETIIDLFNGYFKTIAGNKLEQSE